MITPQLAKDMKTAELDWIQITLESRDKDTHNRMQGREGTFNETARGIVNCINEGLQVSINCTITQDNKNDIKGLVALAKHLGVKIVSANAIINSGRGQKIKDEKGVSEKELKEILIDVNNYAKEIGVEFNWFLPTCYKNLDPIKLGFGQRCCSACSINMMIEPNGDVIPCQSWTQNKLGNILTDKWKKIWNNPECKKIRNFGYASKECKECSEFRLCGGACPLNEINCNRCKR
jgi:radical SAM protein with 4Fe4S-binding SPASM domain